MQAIGSNYRRSGFSPDRLIVPAVAAMASAVAITLILFLLDGGAFHAFPNLFLIPWVIGLAIMLSMPSLILYYKGRFSLADPIVFATWSYFFPAFVLGGFFFAVGWSQPTFLSFIQDVEYTLPFTIILIALGFSGLVVGYFLPVGERIGSFIASRLPMKSRPLRSYIAPGVVLLLLGVMNTGIAFALGLFGYQRNLELSQYEGLIYLTTLFWMQGSFLLWFLVFKQKKLDIVFVPVLVLLLSTSITKIIFAGNRGTIIQIFTIVGLAYVFSGRLFKVKQSIVAGSLFSILLIFGMIYGTTFRQIKGSEAAQGVGQYTENVIIAVSELGNSDLTQSVEFGLTNFAGRVDILTTLAVVVSNYEALKPYEEAYGLDNNIWIDTTTFFIPRVIWSDKPAASDARKYSDLYFNWGESSFAITPIGDLLRNFGVWGVPIGMFVVGLCLRVIYRALVENQTPVIWRLVLYFMLLATVSYEGFFGTIIPNFFKVGVIATVGIMIVSLFANILTRRSLSNMFSTGR
jgi:hypothetical protein